MIMTLDDGQFINLMHLVRMDLRKGTDPAIKGQLRLFMTDSSLITIKGDDETLLKAIDDIIAESRRIKFA